jgi:hypothetical protein
MNNLRAISSSGGGLPPSRLHSAAALHQALHCVLLVIGGKMGISHCHLDRPVAHELSDGAQINSSHDKSRGEGMPVAMPIPASGRLFTNSVIYIRSIRESEFPAWYEDRFRNGIGVWARIREVYSIEREAPASQYYRDGSYIPYCACNHLSLDSITASAWHRGSLKASNSSTSAQ